MSFGKQSGPPASAKQIQYLLALIQKEGHADFRDARHPLGLTQRQAGGKFTVGEASALIDRLVSGQSPEPTPLDLSGVAPEPAPDGRAELLRGTPADALAAELERRGWTVTSPSTER